MIYEMQAIACVHPSRKKKSAQASRLDSNDRNNASKRGGKAEEAKQLRTTRDECEIRLIMQTKLESYNSTMCEHNAVF